MLKKEQKMMLDQQISIPAGGKSKGRNLKAAETALRDHPAMPILEKLKMNLTRWNQLVGDAASTRQMMPEALHTTIQLTTQECANLLAMIATDMEELQELPHMAALMASMAECKKMEIRRGCMNVTELVEKNTNKRLHTQLFFQALESQSSGQMGRGLDSYKDIMEELIRRLSLFSRMGFMDENSMNQCITELRGCSELFGKKRQSILEKANIPMGMLDLCNMLVDSDLKMPKEMTKMNQVSLATFDTDPSSKLIAANFAHFYDDIRCGNVELFVQVYRTKRKMLKNDDAMMMPVPGKATRRRAVGEA